MRHLGLDVGKVRVGVAASDDGGTMAFPLEVVSREECIDRVRALIVERNVDTVVIGESLDLDGRENDIMEDARAIARQLAGDVRVVFEPEQFSTQAAARLGKGSDAEAAAVILQSRLDRCASSRSGE